MSDIAVGATVFEREEKIAQLLESIDPVASIGKVYLGDNGERTQRKEEIYSGEYPFELEVLDLEYDSGLGHSRRRIVEESEEPYLMIVDNDVTIPPNVLQLHSILKHRPDLGGVGGVLIEGDCIRSDCHDLYEDGSILVKHISESKEVQNVANVPLVEFDQIQNVTLYRRECLEDYRWDSTYKIGWEHTDFFVGHKKQTDWLFGVCPEVMFRHYPGGNINYMTKRRNVKRLRDSKRYFLNKWGYDQVLVGQVNWLQTAGGLPTKRRIVEQLFKHFLVSLPSTVQGRLLTFRDKIRALRGKPPA